MSILNHYGTSEARRALKSQRRTATLVSLIVALLLMVLLALILAVILFAVGPAEKPPLLTYTLPAENERSITPPKVQTQVKRLPAAPSMAMSPMVKAETVSPLAIPVPEITVAETALEIGVGSDFGLSWESGEDFGSGSGSGATFFGKTSQAERIAYVIDFSGSMRADNRDQLMRDELTESISLMHPGLQLGMIFFAGPAWVAGDRVNGETVTTSEGKRYEWTKGEGYGKWEPRGEKQKAPWWTITDEEVERLTQIVKTAPLKSGTVWDNPLHMALDMEPAPQSIYFMTDGAAGDSKEWAREVGKRAKKMGVAIHCVALMQPRAEKDLKTIARLSGGSLTVVKEGGERKKIRDYQRD